MVGGNFGGTLIAVQLSWYGCVPNHFIRLWMIAGANPLVPIRQPIVTTTATAWLDRIRR